MNSYERVIEIYNDLLCDSEYGKLTNSTDYPISRKATILAIANEIDKFHGKSFWKFCEAYNALDEERSCEDFAIKFMTEFNKTCWEKY